MKPVSPDEITAIALDRHHVWDGRFFTARACFRQLMNGRIQGIDAEGNAVTWTGATGNIEAPASTYCWQDGTIALYDDQPCMRSVASAITGEETRWPIPTIAVRTYYFGVHQHKGENISLKKLYRIQKGTCQYCGNKISFSEATKDHILPRSKHGTNDDSNIALACKRCNSLKADVYPFYDKDGKVPTGVRRHRFTIPDEITIREEWKPYMFLD